MSNSYTTSSYSYSSSTSTNHGTSTTGHRSTTNSFTDPSGFTTVRTAHQNLGEPAVIDERRYDRSGNEEALIGGPDNRERITELGEGDSEESGHVYGGPAVVSTEDEQNKREGELKPERGERDIDRVTYGIDLIPL